MNPVWIKFEEMRVQNSARLKTKMWAVLTLSGTQLGTVRWYGGWRRYAFYPNDFTLYEEKCLRDIAQFLQERTSEHRRVA